MRTSRQRGSVLILTAILIPALIMILGLGLDLGVAYAVRNKAQNTADAAALAGAWACKLDGGACLGNSDAQTAANQAAQANPIVGQVVTPSSVSVYSGASCTDSLGNVNYCVHVTLNATSPVFFAKMFNWTSIPLNGVQATAQANTGFGSGFTTDCQKPIFIPSTVTTVPTGCSSTSPTAALSSLASGTVLCNIRPTDPSGALVPSQYYSLDYSSLLTDMNTDPNGVKPVVFSDGTYDIDGGAHVYRDAWGKCMVNALNCGQKIRVQTGVSAGPTSTGVKDLMNQLGPSGTFYAPVWGSPTEVVNGNEFFATIIGYVKFDNLTCGGGRGIGAPCGDPIQATFRQWIGCATTTGLGVNTGSYDTPVRLINQNLASKD